MQKTILQGLVLAACLSLNCFAQGPAATACVQDLETIPGFLLENDAGARDHLAQLGQKYFDDAFAEAKTAALQIRGNASCLPVITKYLKMWRRGHLWVEDIAVVPAAQASATATPTATGLAEDLTAQRLKERADNRDSFSEDASPDAEEFELWNRDPLVELIKAHRADLEGHPNWIIDVRGNPGGADSSYWPLRPWLMADEVASAGTQILATPANLEGWTRICALDEPGDAECPKILSDSIERMPKAAPGTWVGESDGGAMSYYRVDGLEQHRPLRVAVLIDGGCGSSCEEFVLEARQSFNVKLIGRHTFGSVDYASVRPHDLPSGRRRLRYVTTRSSRIPGLMVDVAGVQPDIYLPAEARDDEVLHVRSWLEGGSVAPRGVK
jgi:hypothetical protein